MNLRTKLTAAATLLLLAAPCLSASAFPIGKRKPVVDSNFHKPTPAQNALIDKAIAREAVVVKTLRERAPLVETYIQNMKADPVMGSAPESDQHFLGRVDFGKVINNQMYKTDERDKHGKLGFLRGSLGYITGLGNSLHLHFNEAGFVQMLLLDSNSFNRQMYEFSYVRNDFLGTVPTVVFDVRPTNHHATGRFIGRIWIERNNGNIVRFNGDFGGSDSEDIKEWYHFDSWRTNVQEGLWLPTAVYVEETDPRSATHVLKFKAINHIWGYALKVPTGNDSLTDITVLDANDASNQAADVSPLQAQREWVQQAEDNVIDRLFRAGLIDAPSDFDKTLSDLANNILAYNQIATTRPLKVRTLLTEPLESLAIGNTILLSKSMIDTAAVPDQDGTHLIGNLYCMLAFQVAHIILGHHIDTKYAFNDRLLFPDEAAFHRLPMQHTNEDDATAAKKALELLAVKDLVGNEQYFGLYLQQLNERKNGLRDLNTPQIGDSLIKPDGTFWMGGVIARGPKLNDKDLKQQGAMPLGQFLKFDPWTDQVVQKHVSYEPLLSPVDKYPFEITPVYMKLAYWTPPTAPAPGTPGAAPATTGDNSAAPAAPADASGAPALPATAGTAAATTGTSNPPQQ